jgi:hypothetical protein
VRLQAPKCPAPDIELFNLVYVVETEVTLSDNARHCLRLAQEELRRIAQIVQDALRQNPGDSLPVVANIGELRVEVFMSKSFKHPALWSSSPFTGNVPVYTGQLREFFCNVLLNGATRCRRAATCNPESLKLTDGRHRTAQAARLPVRQE